MSACDRSDAHASMGKYLDKGVNGENDEIRLLEADKTKCSAGVARRTTAYTYSLGKIHEVAAAGISWSVTQD